MEVHHFTVDAYAVQHPGDGSRQVIQSVELHLARLSVQLDGLPSPNQTNGVMQRFAARKEILVLLTPPKHISMMIADIASYAGSNSHTEKVREWAQQPEKTGMCTMTLFGTELSKTKIERTSTFAAYSIHAILWA